MMKPLLKYINRLLISCSILLNVILGGKSNQTFAARNFQRELDYKINIAWILDIIFWFDPHHSEKSWMFWNEIQKHYIDQNIFK